jgi:hypothetical protein
VGAIASSAWKISMQRTRVWTTRHLILIVLAVGVLWLFAGLIAGPARTLRGWEARPDLQVDLSARPEGEVVAAARLKPFQFLFSATAERWKRSDAGT